jgi:hypothetical protein
MTSFRIDPSSDFEAVCNDFINESATLRIGNTDLLIPKILGEPHVLRELEPSGGYVTRNGTLFVWSKSRSSRPPLGSILIDHEGIYWTIWKIEDKQHVETWEAFCLNLNVVSKPFNWLWLLRGVYGKGEANEARADWVGYLSGVPGGDATDRIRARLQPSEETAQIEFGAEWRKETYRAYFEQPWPKEAASGDFRLIDTDGFRYRIERYYDEERIDRLPVAFCVRFTEGAEYWHNPGPGA